jgi:hypothetical protein
MVRRGLTVAAVAMLAGCGREGAMPDRVELADTMAVHHAMEDAAPRDSMLDTIPGGEMARGDTGSEMRLLKKKM